MEGTEQPLPDDYVYAVRDEAAYLQADDEKPPIPSEPFPWIVCQFCGTPFEQVAGLFEANVESGIPTPQPSRLWICYECVARMAQILAEESPGPPWLRRWRQWTPGGLMRP